MNDSDHDWHYLESSHLTSDSTEGQWYLVHVQDGIERRAAKFCEQHGIPFIVSLLPNDAGKHVNIAWPGYIFCRLSMNKKEILSGAKFVHGIQPIVNERAFLNEIRLFRGLNNPNAQEIHAKGDHVTIYTGSFAGHFGTLKEFRSNGAKACVEILVRNRKYDLEVASDSLLDKHALFPQATRLATFSRSIEVHQQSAIALAPINDELIAYLARHPEVLYQVDPYRFEELIAELLMNMGYAVHLTPPSKDGGRDILAILKIPLGEILTIVDCKRYSHTHRIGPDIIQRLLWIADHGDKASRAMIATTSFFTSGAKALEEEYRWRLTLSDFNDVSGWLSNYGQWRQTEGSGVWLPSNLLSGGATGDCSTS